ncbi:hypothetical protein XBO1_2110043 [Xenorhabdus bovienii str. oregonense]|uniref:Uncharacterized protein n=1 Tax=Xenorhabdus bovienii str. oregonense TaxID=1398202 RepID=A0A077P4N7_XENBV|nr:hypothetical protein XBO1_2110043 [Xenorhabdus bovienii str. oregonense]
MQLSVINWRQKCIIDIKKYSLQSRVYEDVIFIFNKINLLVFLFEGWHVICIIEGSCSFNFLCRPTIRWKYAT